MSKFKVGDKVRVIDDKSYLSHGVRIGMCGIVRATDRHIGVEFEDTIRGHSINCLVGKKASSGLWIEPESLELIEETQMTQQFKNMKIRIKDEAHSRLVQETLFEMGCRWQSGDYQSVRNVQSRYLYVDDYYMSHGITDSTFENEASEEVELVTTYSFKVVDKEAQRKAAEKEDLQKNVAEMQKQLDEMKQKLESM